MWQARESELQLLQNIILPKCYTSHVPTSTPVELRIFSDASKRAYGSVAYLMAEDDEGRVQVSFEHPVTKLLVLDYDNGLLHPGPDCVLAEIRRTYWILCDGK